MSSYNILTRLRRPSGYLPACFVALSVLLPTVLNSSWLDILILTTIMAGAASAWNLFGGYTGYFSLGHVVFFGIGAYTTSLLFSKFAYPPLFTLILGMLLAALVSYLIGLPTLGLEGHYFALASLATVVIAEIIFDYFGGITGGGAGVQLLFDPSILNLMFEKSLYYYYSALIYLFVVLGATWYIDTRKFGYYLKAIREDENAAEMLGVNTRRMKQYSLALSAAFTSIGGSLYVCYTLFISPSSAFDLFRSIYFALYPVIGGIGTIIGPLVGAILIDPLRGIFSLLFGGSVAIITNILYGIILILVVMVFPDGVVPQVRGFYGRILNRLPTIGKVNGKSTESNTEGVDK